MQQKQAAKQLGVSVGAVHNWVRAYRRGGMAALQPRNQNAAQGGKSASVRPRGGADAGGAAMTWRRCAVGSRSWSWRTR
ncbi:helix-turn-helix domain-containing protein [Bifidobacterium longum]|nr:helix-turn-helix domain-containing protein [Bifidobacterium longum]